MRQILVFLFLVQSVLAFAQRPQNDTCSKAMLIKLGKGNFGISNYLSDSVNIDSATVQVGEFFHSSLVAAGNDKKSLWFKFYLPARRGINIELKQNGNAIAIRDCGFTTFMGDQCLPTSTMATAAKITTLNQFGSSFHPCMEPGWYIIQVSAKARAMGKVFIEITSSFPYTNSGVTDAKYDAKDSAYYFGDQIIGKKGYKSQYKDFELGCYTIKDSTEYFYGLGSKFNRYTQSAWFVFKANDYSDFAMFGIEGYNFYLGANDTIAYRLYEGDSRYGGPLKLIDSAFTDMGSTHRCYSYYGSVNFHKPCFFDSGKYYTLQFLFHKDEARIMRLTLTDATSEYDVNNNHQPVNGQIYNLGTINTSVNKTGGFSCKSKLSYNACGKVNANYTTINNGYRYHLSNWFKFTLPAQSKVDVLLNGPPNGNNSFPTDMGFRIFKDTATSNCSDISPGQLIYTGNGSAWKTLMCLEKGDYVIQVLGMDTISTYSNYGCYGSMHLGRDYILYINRQSLPEYNKLSLYQKKWADSVYVKADTLSPFPKYQNIAMRNDTIGCRNTVLTENKCDTTLKKAMYRVFKIGDSDKDGRQDSGMVYITGLRTVYNYGIGKYRSDHQLFKGNAIKLRNKQNISLFPDTIKGLKPQTGCFGGSATYGSFCIEPGEYTLVSYFNEDGISLDEKPSMIFYAPRTKFNSYAKAENLGKIGYGYTYGTFDTFSCSTNPDTIDGVYCGRRNTYHVFHLDSVSYVQMGINYWNAYAYGNSRFSLFKGDIRSGKSGLTKFNNDGYWTCNSNSYTRATTECNPFQPGWYTMMVSNDKSIGYDSAGSRNIGYDAYYNAIAPHRLELYTRKPNVILPKFDKPFKAANVDSIINGKKPLSFAKNYSVKKSQPQKLEKFVFPVEYLQCNLDTPFTHYPKNKLCLSTATNIVYYTFSIAKNSWASILTSTSGVNASKVKLYNFDVRRYASRMDTAKPVQNCNANANLLEFCNLKVGTYTLVYFVNRYNGQNSTISPVLYLDSLMPSRFDHAINAYDFGRIPGDSAWHSGKIGDVHPIDTSLAPSADVISCKTGAQRTDPNSSNCYNQWNPYVYNKDSFGVVFPYDSAYIYRNSQYYYINSYGPWRNLWYTFTHKGPGKLTIKLNTLEQKYSEISRHLRFTVYESNANGSLSFDSLKRISGGVDSTIAMGLTYASSDGPYTVNGGWYYCYYPSNFTATINKLVCDANIEKRYYIMVESDNNPDIQPYTFNHHVSLSLKYDTVTTLVPKTKFDYYSQAGSFKDTANKNLIINSTGEYGTLFWTNNFYSFTTTTLTPSGNGTSFSCWPYYLSNSYIQQTVDISDYTADIRSGNCSLDLSTLFQSNMPLSGSNGITFKLEYLDSVGNVLQTYSSGLYNHSGSGWVNVSQSWSIPVKSKKARLTITFNNPSVNYPSVYFNNIKLAIKKSSGTLNRNQKLVSGVIYEGVKTYMGQATVDAADYDKNNKTICGKSVWYKFKVDTTGYLFYSTRFSYQNGTDGPSYYTPYVSKLYREIIPGDSVNGLALVSGTATSTAKFGYGAYNCVAPGWYYLLINPACYTSGFAQTCLDYVQPSIYLEYNQGDYCGNAISMEIDTLEKVTATGIVNCVTIGTDFGEDGSDMGCLFGPKGYKSTWFKVDYKDTAKVDLEFKLAENTTAKPAEIRYRTYYGNCQNLTPAPCNTNSQTSFIINCIRRGTYYIQVITPETTTGTLQMSVEAKKNNDSTCVPVNVFQPNAAFYYNTSCPENVIEFRNTSSRGDSITYEWTLGYNNAKSTDLNPVFAYPVSTKEKSYKVKLVVSMKSRNSKDSIEMDVVVPFSPLVDIKNRDTLLCDGDSVWLKAKISHSTGAWNTGVLIDSIKVGRTGTYYYQMRDKPNLLKNANAERAITTNSWTATKGTWSQKYYTPYAFDSSYYFYAGTSTGESVLTQLVDVSKDSVDIDSGIAKTSLIAFAFSKNEDTPDETQIELEYLDASNNLLAVYSSGYFASRNEWSKISHTRTAPKKTRKVRVKLYCNNLGSDAYNDAYFDNITLRMRSACDYKDSVYVQVNAIPKLKLGKDTTFCYHDTLLLKPTITYNDPFIVIDSMNGTALKGELIGNAKYISAYNYTMLTSEVSGEFGAVNYYNNKLLLTDSFDVNLDVLTENKDGLEGTWHAFYMFNTQKPSSYSFYANGGYSIFIQEYNNYNNLVLYWGSSAIYTLPLNTKLSDKTWRTFMIRYANKKFRFYLGGKLIGTYSDGSSRTQTGYNFGLTATNTYYQNLHLVRNFYITKSKRNLQVAASNKRIFKYLWNDNSTVAAYPVSKSGLHSVKITDQFGCKSNADTINVTRVKVYDSLITGRPKVCSMLDTFRINSAVKSGFYYGNTAIDSSGLVTVNKAVFGSNTFMRYAKDTFGCYYKDTGVFVVDSIPDIIITPVAKVCKNIAPFKLNVNSTDGVFYGGVYVDSAGWFYPSLTNQLVNKVYYRTKGNYCIGMDSITVQVDTVPSAKIQAAGPFCKNAGIKQINHASNSGGKYSGGLYIDSTGKFNPNIAGVSTKKVFYTYTDSRGCKNTDSINVRVDSIPSAKIQAAGPFCKNAGIKQINHASNAGGKYSGGNYIDSIGKFNPNIAGVSTQKVYYTFTDSRGCKNTDSINVRVDSIPSAKIQTAGPFCKNAGIKQINHASNAGGKYSGGLYIDTAGKFNPNIAGVGFKKVYYTFKDSRGCSNTDSVSIRVDSIPSAKIQAAGPFCKNAGIKQINHASNAGGKYSGGTYIDSLGKFNPNIAGVSTQKVYYTFTDSRGCKNTDSINVRVDSIPSAKIQAAGPFCKNAGIKQINHASNAGGKYFGGTYIDSLGKFNPDIAGVSTQKVYYTFTDSRGCKNTDSINVRVDSIPSAKIQAAGPFCKNAGIKQIVHASNAGGKYSGGNYIDTLGKFNPNIASVGFKKVYYTFKDSRGCSNTDSINVRVDSIPSAKIQAAGPFCKNAGIKQINHASNAGGKYSGGNYIDSIGKFNPSIAGVSTQKVFYTFTDSRGCKNTDSISIRVDSIPSAKIQAAGPYCKNAGIKQINHASNAGGKYSGGTYIDSLGKFNPNIAGVSTQKVYYTFTDSRGCKNTDSINVRVDSIPSAKIQAAGPFCKNAGIKQINHASNAGGKYSGGNYIDSIGKFNPNIAGVSTQKVYYTFVDSRGCKNTDSINVRVDSIPSAKIQTAGPFCRNAGIKQINHASNAGGKYSGGLYVDSTGKFNPNIAGVSTQKVYYTFTDSRGCKNTDSISIRVDSIPSAKIQAAGPFCKNAGIKQINHASNAGGKYSGGTYIDSVGKFNPNIAGVSTKKVYYTFTDSRGCKNTDSINVRVDSIPSAKIQTAGPFCKNVGIKQINHASNAGGKYSGGSYIDTTGQFNPNTADVGLKKVYYTFKDSRGCSNTDSISIRVDSIPSAKIQAAGPFCKNAGIKQINHASNAGGKYSGGNYVDSLGKFNPNIAGVSTQKVYYTFTDSRGCKNTDSINVRVDSIPSAKIQAAGPFCKNAGVKQINHASNAGGKYSGGNYIDSIGKFNPNIAGVSTQKVFYTFTDSRGCKNTDSISIRVDSIPSAKIQAAGPFCRNAGIKQINHASNAGGKYSGGLYIDTAGKFNPNIAGVGFKKVYYTFKDSRGCSNTDSISIRVDSIPSAKIQAAGPFCKNAGIKQINHSSNAGGKYSGGNYIDSIGKFNPNIAGISTQKVYYTFTDSRGCKNTDSINVRVDSIPSAKIQTAGPFCKNAGIKQINHASNAGGKYSGGNYIDSIGKFNPNLAGVSTQKVYYTFTDSRGCKNTDSINVRVDSIPSAKIQAAGPFCKNAGIKQINHASNAGGKYSGGNYVDSLGKFNPNIAGVSAQKVYYTFTDSRGCKNTDSINVRVDSVPTAKIQAAGPFCKNAGIKQINHASNAGGKYSGGLYIDSTGKFNPSIAGVSTQKVYYTFVDSRGCKNTDSINVRVDSIPSAKIQTAGPFCKNAGIKQINHASNAGGKYSGGNYIDSIGKFNPSIAGVSTQKVFYTFTDSRGCKSTDSILVKVDSIPNASIVAAGPFCENASAQQLKPKVNLGGYFTPQIGLDSFGKLQPLLAKAGTHKIYYTFKDGNGCSNKDSINVIIDKIPDASMLVAGPYCSADAIQAIKPNVSGGVFSGGVYVDNTGKFDPSKATIGFNKVKYQLSNSSNCIAVDSIDVEVIQSPNNTIVYSPDKGCDPLLVKFETQAAFKITWTLNNKTSNNQKDSAILTANSYVLQLDVENARGCKQQLSENIVVHPLPIANFNYTPTKVYINDPQVLFKDNSSGNIVGWNWYFGDQDSSKIQDPGHDYQKAGTYKVELYIVDKNGCIDSTSRTVTVLDDFVCFIPDIITPNGDGHNEVFSVVGMGIKNVACQIFNRWGEQLYNNDQFVSWDATYQNEIVQDGVYLYLMQIKDNKGGMHYLKGEITVLR